MLHYQGQVNNFKNFDLGIDVDSISPKNYAHLMLYSWAGGQLPGGVIVDAGCEMGFGMKLLHRPDRKLLGMDINLQSLLFSKQHNSHQDKITHICGDLLKIPMAKNSCNGVCLINTLHLIKTPQTLLKECQRVLIKGHPLIVSVPLDYNLPEEWRFPTTKTYFNAILSEVCSDIDYPQVMFEMMGSSGEIIRNSMASYFLTAICYNL